MCCTSLRGVAFFGASVHIAIGFILFSRYVIATVIFTFYNFNNLFSEKVTALVAPFMVYVTLLLALGLVIFHSVEKECFLLLKWSSVAFSLLQLVVFVAILVLKLLPSYDYKKYPLLPESLVPSGSGSQGVQSEIYIAVPHGTTLNEKDIIIRPSAKSPSSDPPDPGGSESPTLNNDDGIYYEVQRLTILITCVLMTLIYLVFLFLYIRQLNYEDTGHVFGHAQAITRNIAFYVQPQYTTSSTTEDNKTLGQGVQRSQTQIPAQFLPQQEPTAQGPHQPHSSPSKRALGHEVQSSSSPATTTTEVHHSQRSPARSLRQPQQGPNYSPKRHITDASSSREPLEGPSIRSPIPAQVRIGFYPEDLPRDSQPQTQFASHETDRAYPAGPVPSGRFYEPHMQGPGPPLGPYRAHLPVLGPARAPPPPRPPSPPRPILAGPYGPRPGVGPAPIYHGGPRDQFEMHSGPPPPPMRPVHQYHPQPPPPHAVGMQGPMGPRFPGPYLGPRGYPSDSSSSVAYSPNPIIRSKYPISMV